MAMMDSFEGRTCFVAAPIETDLSPVIASLIQRGIKCNQANWFDLRLTPASLKNAIRRSDFVCVFSPVAPPDNLWFEVGLVIGLGKPIFMVAPQDFLMHSALSSMSFVGASEWNSDVVEPHLDAFLRTLPRRRSTESRKKRRLSKPVDYSDEREQIESFVEKSEAELETFVENLFRKAGLNVTTAPLKDFGADMAVWSPSIKENFGDPILVEVKRLSALVDHSWGIERLSDLVKSGRASAAIYLTIAPIEQDPALGRATPDRIPVLLLSVSELIDLLESNRFIESIRDARNRIHGNGI